MELKARLSSLENQINSLQSFLNNSGNNPIENKENFNNNFNSQENLKTILMKLKMEHEAVLKGIEKALEIVDCSRTPEKSIPTNRNSPSPRLREKINSVLFTTPTNNIQNRQINSSPLSPAVEKSHITFDILNELESSNTTNQRRKVHFDDEEMSVASKEYLRDLEFGRTLGTGSFGRVQLVRHMPTGRYYALKKLRKTEVIRLKQIEHTNNERKLLALARNHPFLVQMIGTTQDLGYLYVLMEYVSGGELFSLLRKVKTLPNFVAQFYAAQVILAFEHLHSQHIIYRDLKPENILITPEGNIKIVDFGFAKEVPDQTWTLCGTPDYLAPEIVLSKGYGRAVDYYALGVLIYEMLAGFPPFYHENHMKLYDNIVNSEARFPPSFDPIAKDLVLRLLEKNPAKRLGVQAGGISDIKNHIWFKDVKWDMLYSCTIRAPFKPKLTSDGDCSNFDIYTEETENERISAQTTTIENYSLQEMMDLFPEF